MHRQTPIFFKDMTVKENIESFIELLEFDIKYEEIEQQYQLGKISKTVTGKLSGGEKQKLYLAITSLNRDNILLFDEADSALDPESRKFYYQNVLKKIVGMGKSVFVDDEIDKMLELDGITEHSMYLTTVGNNEVKGVE